MYIAWLQDLGKNASLNASYTCAPWKNENIIIETLEVGSNHVFVSYFSKSYFKVKSQLSWAIEDEKIILIVKLWVL